MSRQDANAVFARTSFLYGGNAAYIEDLYARFEKDPAAVDAEWRAFFEGLKDTPADVAKKPKAAKAVAKDHRGAVRIEDRQIERLAVRLDT